MKSYTVVVRRLWRCGVPNKVLTTFHSHFCHRIMKKLSNWRYSAIAISYHFICGLSRGEVRRWGYWNVSLLANKIIFTDWTRGCLLSDCANQFVAVVSWDLFYKKHYWTTGETRPADILIDLTFYRNQIGTRSKSKYSLRPIWTFITQQSASKWSLDNAQVFIASGSLICWREFRGSPVADYEKKLIKIWISNMCHAMAKALFTLLWNVDTSFGWSTARWRFGARHITGRYYCRLLIYFLWLLFEHLRNIKSS